MIFSKLFGGGSKSAETEAPGEAVEHEGYRIIPAPIKAENHYQTAGFITRTIDGEEKKQRFIRADMHVSREGAEQHAIQKAKQIILEQGDRLFRDDDRPA